MDAIMYQLALMSNMETGLGFTRYSNLRISNPISQYTEDEFRSSSKQLWKTCLVWQTTGSCTKQCRCDHPVIDHVATEIVRQLGSTLVVFARTTTYRDNDCSNKVRGISCIRQACRFRHLNDKTNLVYETPNKTIAIYEVLLNNTRTELFTVSLPSELPANFKAAQMPAMPLVLSPAPATPAVSLLPRTPTPATPAVSVASDKPDAVEGPDAAPGGHHIPLHEIDAYVRKLNEGKGAR